MPDTIHCLHHKGNTWSKRPRIPRVRIHIEWELNEGHKRPDVIIHTSTVRYVERNL